MFILYGLYDPRTSELRYIGITTRNINRRLREHVSNPTNPRMAKWINDLTSLGITPTITVIREYHTYDDLLQGEIIEIKQCRDLDIDLYNFSLGGDLNPMFGNHHSEESKKKMSLQRKGRKMTDDQCKKHRERSQQRWADPDWVDDKRIKCSERSTGDLNANWRGGKPKCSVCGKIISRKAVRCMKCYDKSGENGPFYNKHHDKNTLEKRSKKVKELKLFADHNNPNFKYEIERDELYNLYINQRKTTKEIAQYYGCSVPNVLRVLIKYNIKRYKTRKYHVDIEILKSEYINNNLSITEISKKYNIPYKQIHKKLKKHGIL